MSWTKTALIVLALGLTSGCASTQAGRVGTDAFIDSTLRQYGIGPNGRVGQPDAVVADPGIADVAV